MNSRFLLIIITLLLTALNNLYSQNTKIYWIVESDPNGRVYSSGIDGSNVTELITGSSLPISISVDTVSTPNKIYYNESNASRIVRTNLDGTGLEEVVTGVGGIRDLELDLINRKIYWIKNSFSDDRVSRADMDSLNSNIEDLYTSTSTIYDFNGIGIDVPNQKVYWVQRNNGGSDKIQRMNFDGSGVETIIDNNDVLLLGPWDIDVAGNKIYWSDPGLSEDRIMCANKDGSQIDTVITEVDALYFIVDSAAYKIYWTDNYLIGQANLDGSNKTVFDPGIGGLFAGITLGNDSVLVSVNPITDLPNKFNLFQNYPNPFNPSTSIKYNIPYLSFVTIKVYDVLGNEIETLVNAEKPAGNYEVEFNSHSGEVRNLPSGIYFYRLVSNHYVKTNKMILLK